MTETTTQKDGTGGKKNTNPLVFIGIGCLVLIVLAGVGTSLFIKFFAKKAGTGLLQGIIEKQTGIKTNLSDVEKGKMSFTDEKTGETVSIGSGKIPDTFPKDFPVYPGAKVTSVLSGSEKGNNSGFWVTLSTADSLEKVSTYYKTNLPAGGWEVLSSYQSGDSGTITVNKDAYNGSVSITRTDGATETEIMIILGQEKTTPSTDEE